MFLRCHKRKKDGKEHRYYSVEESRRLQSGKVVQRRVLYLGEISDSQQASWRKTLEVFDEQQQRATTLRLFPEDRPAPAAVLDTIQVKLSEIQLRRARPYGNCWLVGSRHSPLLKAVVHDVDQRRPVFDAPVITLICFRRHKNANRANRNRATAASQGPDAMAFLGRGSV
jgi:hypothetical protein